MARLNAQTDDLILEAARAIVRENGPEALTFDAVALRVGVSKQAVIYWFPNKARLIEALVRPALENEAAAACSAIRTSDSPATAMRGFVSALAAFHMSDLDRFRLMYVAPQIGQRAKRGGEMLTTLGRIHPATTQMYDALADILVADPRYARKMDARRAAVTIHTALLGLILRLAMADALNAPLRHRQDGLVEALLGIIAPEAA